jgi:hypothetical protein
MRRRLPVAMHFFGGKTKELVLVNKVNSFPERSSLNNLRNILIIPVNDAESVDSQLSSLVLYLLLVLGIITEKVTITSFPLLTK